MMTCSVTTSFLGCLVSAYLFFRYTWFLELSLMQRSFLFALFMLIGCIPLFVSYKLEAVLGSFYPFYRYALYYIFIGSIILSALTLIADAGWWISGRLSQWLGYGALLKNGCWCYWGNLAVLSLAALLTAYALIAGIKVPAIKRVEFASDKIKQEQTVVLLTDLHIHRVIDADKIKGIVARANAQNPDIILLGGDIIDDDVEKVSPITALLKDLKAKNGVYFVTGNHEFYAGYHETVDELKKLGFIFLENNGVAMSEDIYLAGIPDLFSAAGHGVKIEPDKAFSEAKDGQFRLLMSHTPADFEGKNNFDLEVSGHTHGGQIFPFHIFASLHNKYLAGRYNMANHSQIYVSRGAGQWGPQMRFLAPSEITVIKLKPQKQGEKQMDKAPIDTVFAQGEANPYGKFFTGKTYLNMLNPNDGIFNAPIGNVTFEPGARTNWHKHSGGQILLVLAGEGRYQERGKGVRVLRKGDVVRIAPDIEHWHGAAPDSWFTHISLETNVPDNKAEWLEPVTDEQYK